MTTVFGWSQSYPNWIISKNNQDTIITYNFTKQEFTNLRLYVTGLEMNNELYQVEKQKSSLKDSLITNLKTQISNKDTIISLEKKESKYLNDWGTTQEIQRIKAEKKNKAIPYFFGGGGVLGLLLGILLFK